MESDPVDYHARMFAILRILTHGRRFTALREGKGRKPAPSLFTQSAVNGPLKIQCFPESKGSKPTSSLFTKQVVNGSLKIHRFPEGKGSKPTLSLFTKQAVNGPLKIH